MTLLMTGPLSENQVLSHCLAFESMGLNPHFDHRNFMFRQIEIDPDTGETYHLMIILWCYALYHWLDCMQAYLIELDYIMTSVFIFLSSALFKSLHCTTLHCTTLHSSLTLPLCIFIFVFTGISHLRMVKICDPCHDVASVMKGSKVRAPCPAHPHHPLFQSVTHSFNHSFNHYFT